MKQYHKIQTVFLRDPETKFRTLLLGEFAKPEFEYLKDLEWVWTEKIDGTNIRIGWNGINITYRGKTDKANIPKELFEKLIDMFKDQKDLFASAFDFEDVPEDKWPEVIFYGEGYGRKIQKGGNYIADGVNFILFDVRIGNIWLTRESVEDIGNKFGLKIVPILGEGTLDEAIEFVKTGFKSTISENPDYIAEGIVARPKVELLTRNGKRLITKIKHCDFK